MVMGNWTISFYDFIFLIILVLSGMIAESQKMDFQTQVDSESRLVS